MSRTDTLLKSLLYVLGGLATLVFLITKNPAALTWAAAGEQGYGDLYRFSQIRQFQPAEPLVAGRFAYQGSFVPGRRQPVEAQSILVGDSFSFCDWGETPFHMQLRQELRLSMFSVPNHHDIFWENSGLLLQAPADRPTVPRVLVYEIVERSIASRFAGPISVGGSPRTGTGAVAREWWRKIKECVFDGAESKHEALLKHNRFTSPAIGFWNSTMFELFRQVPAETPVYSLQPPFLFYKEEVACFQSAHDQQLVENLADNIARLSGDLRQHFGCTMLFVPIPNKITLYSRLALALPYDGFLPRLCAALKSRGVNTVELLPLFQQQTELLYWPTDTHWNNRGIRLAVEQTLKEWPQTRPE